MKKNITYLGVNTEKYKKLTTFITNLNIFWFLISAITSTIQ